MRVGIDLLWVRHGICGGTESYVRNLIQGFGEYDSVNEYVLFTAQDNRDVFAEYLRYKNISMADCPVNSAVPAKRILWENLFLGKKARENDVEVMFIPVYSKPWDWNHKMPYVSVIHDLQAVHFPEYFSAAKRAFFKRAWKYTCRSSEKVVAISEFGRRDLIQNFPGVQDKAVTIYNPVISRETKTAFDAVADKYGIKANRYYYCVSSLLPHKNLDTILKVMARLKSQESTVRLVLSGVGGEEDKFNDMLRKLEIEEQVIQTGFVSDEERDCLYENCRLFLFPSIFEGFGMPPIEAMRKGKNVVMTGKSCLREITEDKAYYVEDPTDIEEWVEKIRTAEKNPGRTEQFERYTLKKVVEQYMAQWNAVVKG